MENKSNMVYNVMDNVKEVLHLDRKENTEVQSEDSNIQEIEKIDMGLHIFGKIKINEGIIYSNNIEDLVEQKLPLLKDYLWINEDSNRYMLYNGFWWVELPLYKKLEDIEYVLFDINTLKKVSPILIS